jgi:hypothetical protein
MKQVDKLRESLEHWYVVGDWKDTVENYLYNGYTPGSFFTAVFANDLVGAASRSHPSNTWRSIQDLCKWMANSRLSEAFGSYEKVNKWLKLSAEKRHQALADAGLLYSAWDILSHKEPA